MNEFEINKLINDKDAVDTKIKEFIQRKVLFKQKISKQEIQGHILKAEHNSRFVSTIIEKEYFDWAITGCYYSVYHSALALIQSKGFTSKNHFATLCVLIKEFYDNELSKYHIEIFSNLLDYEEILFYVESKNKREEASYSSKIIFDKNYVEELRVNTALFLSKAKDILRDFID
jgi:uncharacterized protein (UPF0332 family)